MMKNFIYGMLDDEIVLVNADKLILKDLSDGENVEYFRE